MALNLWKIGGQPTSYNPLPSGWSNKVPLGFGDYIITFYASSNSSTTVLVTDNGGDIVSVPVSLTTNRKLYSVSISNKKRSDNLNLYDNANKGDIIIDSISLVQKPLNKLTVNGIDGFLSGKWTLHPNATVVDDETLMLNVTGTFQNSYIIIPTNLNTNYVFTATYQGRMTVANFNGSSTIVGVDNYSSFSQQTLAFNSGTNNQVYIYFTSGTSSNGQLMLSKPMLSLGSIPAPYSKKTGDRMVMPTPKKNMLPQPDATLYNQIGTSAVNNTVQNGALAVLSYTSRDYGKGISVNVSPNKPYTFSTFLDKNGNTVNGYIEIGYTQTSHEMLSATINAGQFSTTFTPAQSTINIRFVALSSSAISNPLLYSNIQLEQGTVRTDYTPYAIQLNKLSQRMDANGKPTTVKRKTGLSFNGLTDYLQLPSMTMDAVEIECLIDSNQPNTGYHNIIDARNGLPLGYASFLNNGGISGGGDILSITGAVKDVRAKIKVTAKQIFTDNVTVFGYNTGTQEFTKGILYKVTCYLNGAIVAQYDFENAQNIIGNQVIPNAQSLIPSFEDAGWTIHANAKVLGKDVLHLDANGSWQSSTISLNVLPNTNYLAVLPNGVVGASQFFVDSYDINGVKTNLFPSTTPSPKSFITRSDTKTITFGLINNTVAGSFDFIKPQLYQLDGKEGTINGSPVQLNKPSKRNLYAKR